MKTKRNGGFTLIELLVVITIIAILASFAVPVFTKVIQNSQQTKQVNNAKQILTACALFAADKGGGIYPTGTWEDGGFTDGDPSTVAEDCFNDLFETGIMEMELLFWLPQNATKCGIAKPDEDGTLDEAENYWDYISGMNNSVGTLPLLVEGADDDGVTWTAGGGHPWSGSVVVGFADGSSARKESLTAEGLLKADRGGEKKDMCAPDPGNDGWPSSARYAGSQDGGPGGG